MDSSASVTDVGLKGCAPLEVYEHTEIGHQISGLPEGFRTGKAVTADLLERRALDLFLDAVGAKSIAAVDFQDFRQSCFTGSRTLYLGAVPRTSTAPSFTVGVAHGAVCPGCPFCTMEEDAVPEAFLCPDATSTSAVVAASHTSLAAGELQRLKTMLCLAQDQGRKLRPCQVSYSMLYSKLTPAGSHPHMLIEATPSLCQQFQHRVDSARHFYGSHQRCSVCYCHVASLREPSSARRLLRETDHFVALVPFASMPYRVSIVPKIHAASWLHLKAAEVEDLAFLLHLVLKALFHVLDDPSYRMFILSVDSAIDEETSHAHHWTLELHPQLVEHGLQLPSGLRVANQLPEDCAALLRTALERDSAEIMVDDL